MIRRLLVSGATVVCLVFCQITVPAAETVHRKTEAGDYEGLPGVWRPRPDNGSDRTACTSSIERQRWRPDRNGLGQRVYRCETDVFTWHSNRPPDEIEWRKHQLRNKPWVTDGF
jgi:hypothetical protein